MTDFIVFNNADSGAGSLREALASAAANGVGADNILFVPGMAGQVIDLTSGALSIMTGAVSINGDIDGDGDADITIERSEANGATSILVETQFGTTVNLASLVLRNADTGTITGHAGIVNNGTMVITDSVMTGQTTRGISPGTGFSNQTGGSATSGIINTGTLTIRESVLQNMSATGGGGGYNLGTAKGYDGGVGNAGIVNGAGAVLTLDNMQFSAVAATGGAGFGYFETDNTVADGGAAFAGWQNAGGIVSGDAGIANTTATGGAGGFYGGFFGSTGSAFTPSTAGGFTLNDMTGATSGADVLAGNISANTIFGLTGDDTISGDAGTDTLFGGAGSDTLNGGEDGDILNGWTGGDNLNGDAGDDTLNGQVGNDTMNGGAGLDTLRGHSGNDSLNGGDDVDKLYGGSGDDTMHGDGGADDVQGQQGNDMIFGDAGDDRLAGIDGNDTIDGGIGKDNINGGTGTDSLTGGADNDRLTGGANDDQFRYLANGFGRDYIVDFTNDEDTLVIDVSVFQDTHPTVTTVQQMLDTFGTMNGAGTFYKLDFGNGDVIDFKVTAGLSAATLVDDINLIS